MKRKRRRKRPLQEIPEQPKKRKRKRKRRRKIPELEIKPKRKRKRKNDTYVIKYELKECGSEFTCPSVFTRKQATHLVDSANEDFTRANHWMEKVFL